jgi:ABC-type uncharacterized transport system substrate-binding protein
MLLKKNGFWLNIALAVFVMSCLFPVITQAAPFKVLVVMSYDDTYPWVIEIREGIDSALKDTCEVKYFYMDTKRNFDRGHEKAKEAYHLYQEFKPDGVIAADDDAQAMFVVPYMKDKVKTPVMFCGVNAEPEFYGFPASNVSGILERLHFMESIAFVQQLVPSVKTVGFIQKDSPSWDVTLTQVARDLKTFPAVMKGAKKPKTVKEAIEMTKELRQDCDVLFFETLHGCPDESGKPVTDKEIIPKLAEVFGKPTIGANAYHVKGGLLCAVIKMGQEQGEVASQMLLKAMQGTPVSQIPITRNKKGKRMLNVTVMKTMGITPKPEMLMNTEIVRTEK